MKRWILTTVAGGAVLALIAAIAGVDLPYAIAGGLVIAGVASAFDRRRRRPATWTD